MLAVLIAVIAWPKEHHSVHAVAAEHISWQDTTIAIGTAAAALVAALGFVATIWITRSDRRRNDLLRWEDKNASDWRAIHEKIEAEKRIADERRHAAEEATRRFHLETLLKAVEAYGDMINNQSYGNLSQVARGRVQTYLLALPPEIGVCMRWALGMTLSTEANRKLAEICNARGQTQMPKPAPIDAVYAETEGDVTRLLMPRTR